MSAKRKSNADHMPPFASDEFIFWCAACVVGYSVLVPLLAIESMFLAELAMRFAAVHQIAILLLVFLKSLSLFGLFVTGRWKNRNWLTVVAAGLMLAAVQPATQCCTTLVAAIAGMLPWFEVSPLDVVVQMMPMIGSALIMFEPFLADGELTRRSAPSQSSN
jgi:hypothetical protein